MAQFRDIPIPDDARRVRLELSAADIESLQEIGRQAGDLPLAAVARVTMSMVAQRMYPVDDKAIVARLKEILAATAPPKEPKPRRPRGRPPKVQPPQEEAPKKKKRGRPKKEEGDD